MRKIIKKVDQVEFVKQAKVHTMGKETSSFVYLDFRIQNIEWEEQQQIIIILISEAEDIWSNWMKC